MLFRVLLALASSLAIIHSTQYELYSEYSSERWFFDDKNLVPVSCNNGDCSQFFAHLPKHKIAKRPIIQVNTMQEFIKFLIGVNKTTDDDINSEPYLTGNLTLGVVTDEIFVGNRQNFIDLFVKTNAQITEEMKYLHQQNFSVTFFSPYDLLPTHVNTIISILPCDLLNRFDRTLVNLPIVHIAITSNNCPRISRWLVLMVPVMEVGDELPQLFTDLRMSDTLKWKETIIIKEERTSDDLFNGVVESLAKPAGSKNSLALTTVQLHGPVALRKKNFEQQLSGIYIKPKGRNFIMIAKQDTALWALDAATAIGLVNPYSQWLFLFTDSQSDTSIFLPIIEDGQNVSFMFNATDFDLINVNASSLQRQKNDLTCYANNVFNIYIRVLHQVIRAEETRYFQTTEDDWKRSKPKPGDRSNKVYKSLKNIWKNGPVCGSWLQWRLHAIEMKVINQPQMLEVARWDPAHGLVVYDDLFPHFTGGLRKRVLNVATIEYPPWQIFERDGKGQVVRYTGLVLELAKELGNRLNFSLNFIEPADGQWGSRISFSRWTGLVEQVRTGSVAFAAAGFAVTADRMSAINFTMSLDAQPYTFMFARPKQLSRAYLFTQPYTPTAWASIFATTLCAGPLIWLFNKVSPYYQFFPQRPGTPIFSIWYNIWYCIGGLFYQGQREMPLAMSGRMLIGFYYIFVIIVLTAYSGNLVAFLTFPAYNNPINTLQDLLNNRKSLSWGIIRGTALEDFLRASDEPKLREIYEGSIFHEKVDENLLDMIRNQNHVYIEWKTNLQWVMKKDFLKKNSCDFSLGTENFFMQQVAVAFPKDSPILENVNKEINYMIRGGFIEHWREEFWPSADRCSETATGGDDGSFIPAISVSDAQGSFYLLFIGCGLAAVAFIAERLIYRQYEKREKEIIRPFVN